MTNDIDFGKIKVPTSWNEVTLKKFQDIERYYSEKSDESFNVLDVIDIMIDKDKDYVMSLPSEFVGIILEKLAFLQQSPVIGEPTNKLTIDGETYQVNVQNQLKTGEYIQTQTLLKSDPHNYAALMAVICRKPGEEYTTQYEAEVLEDIGKLTSQATGSCMIPKLCKNVFNVPSLVKNDTQQNETTTSGIICTTSIPPANWWPSWDCSARVKPCRRCMR